MTAKVVYKIIFSGKNSSPPFAFTVKVDRKSAEHEELNPLRYVGLVRTESFNVEGIETGGKRGKRIAYSFLEKSESKGARFPQLNQVYTDVFRNNYQYIVFSYKADSAHFKDGQSPYEKILSSLKWHE